MSTERSKDTPQEGSPSKDSEPSSLPALAQQIEAEKDEAKLERIIERLTL